MRFVNSDSLINKLLALGVIERGDVRGRYTMADRPADGAVYRRGEVLARFAIEGEPRRYKLNNRAIAEVSQAVVDPGRPRPMRTISRAPYHSSQRNISEALARIPADEDGVVRSYGLEYEINYLTGQQESDLAYLLDTLPPHATERDGSLTSNGVELVFEPMGEQDLIKTVNKLNDFINTSDVNMHNTGMHITYGVNNSTASLSDLNIRLNRLAYAVASVITQPESDRIFGRRWNSYAAIPTHITYRNRYHAFSPRNESAWECRLVHYRADIERIVKFFKTTETVFYRPFNVEDFVAVFNVLQVNSAGLDQA